MSEKKSRILLVAEHPLWCKGLNQLVAIQDDLEIIAQANNGIEALQLASELKPDLIILELHMPNEDGMQTLKKIREAGVTSRIVIHTVADSEADIADAINHGADGYLLKENDPKLMLENIKLALNGEMVLSETIMQALRRPKIPPLAALNSLTNREYEILSLITHGMSNKVIARELNISAGTVKVHVKHLLKKLGLSSRVEAAVWMVKQQGSKV